MDIALKDWVSVVAEYIVSAIDAMALLLIAVGTIEMFFTCVRAVFSPSSTGRELRDGYLRYARWLMAGLTFQLAMDIIESARAPTWGRHWPPRLDRCHPHVPELLPRTGHRGSRTVPDGAGRGRAAAAGVSCKQALVSGVIRDRRQSPDRSRV